MLIRFFLMMIISTSLTVSTQPSPRFHVEAWLPFTKNGLLSILPYEICQGTKKSLKNYNFTSSSCAEELRTAKQWNDLGSRLTLRLSCGTLHCTALVAFRFVGVKVLI